MENENTEIIENELAELEELQEMTERRQLGAVRVSLYEEEDCLSYL